MNTLKSALLLAVSLLGFPAVEALELEFSPLFHSCGVRCAAEYDFNKYEFRDCRITYREKGTSEWLPAFEPVRDDNGSFKVRTSLVDLKPDTEYEVKADLKLRSRNDSKTGTFRTWAEKVPVAKTICLTPEMVKNSFVIRDKGKPDGWIRYTAAPGTVIDGTGKTAALLVDRAEYVIIDGLTVRGGKHNAVCLNQCRYVRLVNCDISAWCDPENWKFDPATGRLRDKYGNPLYNKNAIFLNRGFGQVIERCYIHDPLLSANSWFYGHPDGPQGIAAEKPRSTVIRYNDICGSDLKWWNDAIASSSNFDLDGGLNRDCDVYGNFLAFANDDAVELDGGQQNVRFFRNLIENCYMGVSIQGCMTGPSFIFDNRIVDLRNEFMTRASAFKTADTWYGRYAASFFYHNTTDQSAARLPLCRFFRITARNNILEAVSGPPNRFPFLKIAADHNLLKTDFEKKNFVGDARFTDPVRSIYTLQEDSPARGKAVPIPGLNSRTSKDLGAPPDLELPFRPFGLSLTAGRRAAFTVKLGAASAPQEITVRASAPVTFSVRKSQDSDWYIVTPAQASLKAGETLTLTVKLLPEKMKTRINYRSVFFLRTSEGWSRPVSVAAVTDFKYPPMNERPGLMSFTPGAPFRPVPDGGVRFEGRNREWKIPFELKEAGGAYIILEVRALDPVPLHDSVSLGMDDEKPYYCGLAPVFTTRYNAVRARQYKSLSKGKHVLRVVPRESLDLKNVYIMTDVRALEER